MSALQELAKGLGIDPGPLNQANLQEQTCSAAATQIIELAAQVERLKKVPYTKTRAEFMESWGVEGMSADKKRIVNAAWDRAEWFFNQQVDVLKAQWQADILAEISLQVSASKPEATPIQIATAIMKESNKIRNSTKEAGDE